MPPRPKKPSEKSKTSALADALNFFSSIFKEQGTVYETHILLQNKTAVAYNDFLSAGAVIEEDIYAAPNGKILQNALAKCGQENYNLIVDGAKIVIKAGKFKASIPCTDPALLSNRWPDNPSHTIDDSFRSALEVMSLIKPELNAQKVHLLAFLLNSQSCISTDGKILLEYWHGLNLPTLPIPKIIIEPILQNKNKLVSMGFSDNSVTFYFDNNSWVKSQLCAGQWPMENMEGIMNVQSNPNPIPPDFFKGLDAIQSFSEGTVTFDHGLLCSHSSPETGGTFEVAGLPKGPVFSIKYLSAIRGIATKADFAVKSPYLSGNGYMCYFFGDKVRGVIAGHG